MKNKKSRKNLKQIYSLTLNGNELVSVKMELPEDWPFPVNLNKQWLKNLVSNALEKELNKNKI